MRFVRQSLAQAVAAALTFCAVSSAFADGRGLLVLQVGSDWCESGECVRRVFEGSDFRRALGDRFDFAVYDDMDNPSEAVKAANEKLAKLRVETKRFPAITCLTQEPRRFFAQIENIPFDVSARALAEQVLAATDVKDKAAALFASAKSEKDEKRSADAIGRALAMLAAQVGEFNAKSLREGDLAWKDEWSALVRLDKGDRFGWKRRFEMGTGISLVEKATKFRRDGDFAGGAKFIATLRAVPTNSLEVVQRQAVDMAEYALWRKDESRKESNKALLRHALSLGRDTVWGQSALGYLILSGEKFEKRRRGSAKVRPRPAAADGAERRADPEKVRKAFAEIKPGVGFDERKKLCIARQAVLRRIGKDGLDALCARPGAVPFVRAFFSDRTWLEDFAWSGRCNDWKGAVLALESIVFQDAGRWLGGGDDAGRRFATALALSCPKMSEAWYADALDAYRATALAKRLHRHALSQPVWQWRFALQQFSHRSYPASVEKGFDYDAELADQQRLLDKYANVPAAKYDKTCWLVPWRQDNCFGENVHRPFYYESWRAADEWILRRYTPVVGGVCGELSKFGSACANAHGLASNPVGQPSHCAYSRRLMDGTWAISYSVGRPTGNYCLFDFADYGPWTYFQAHEGTFEGDRERRLNADRLLEMARFAEDEKCPQEDVADLYARACRAWKTHYGAWRLRGEWIVRAGRPLAEHRSFVKECASALRGWREPLWDVFTPYFERFAKERDGEALCGEIAQMIPLVRQGEDKIQEEGDFAKALERWIKPFAKDKAKKEHVYMAALEAQYGTRDYFAQLMSSCAEAALDDPGMLDRLGALVSRLSAGDGSQSTGLSLAKPILAASRKKDIETFRKLGVIQKRLSPIKASGSPYSERDFGGVIVSADGMLTTSSTCHWDNPANYPYALDATRYVGNAFHTENEKEPWGMVTLAGPCTVRGILVVNMHPSDWCRDRQVPLEVLVSEDGEKWTSVMSEKKRRDEYRVDLGGKAQRARFVKVRRAPGAKDGPFHLTKILVYGDRLY